MQTKDRGPPTTDVSKTFCTEHTQSVSKDPFNFKILKNRNANRKFMNFPTVLSC